MSALSLFGWVSSALIIISLMQARILRFRVLNLAGAALATAVNALLEIWPFAAMNLVISVIDIYWIVRLTRERHDEAVYDVLEVDVDDSYLQHLLRVYSADLAETHPEFTTAGSMSDQDQAARSAFLVQRGDQTAGLVLLRDAGGGTGEVQLDYVTENFRDFTPGEFVYRRSGIFAERGFTRLIADDLPAWRDYYQRVGFHRVQDHWEREVEPAAA